MEHRTERTERTIDQQGRITLPYKLMQRLGWGSGDELAFHGAKSTIILSMSKWHEGPRCVICNNLEQKISINGVDICGNCLQEIMMAGA